MSGVPCYIISWQMQVPWRLTILLQKKKKKKWELLDYFSWVLGTTNGIISVFWKMSSSHATIPGKIHLGNTGIYKDPSGLLKNIVVGILLKHVY